MNIHEQYSRFNRLYLLKEKSEAPQLIKDYISWFRNQTGTNIKTLISDGGGEFCNATVRQALNEIGAEHVVIPSSAHQMNGVAERQNQTISKLARTMLIAARLKNSFWGEACLCAAYILNLLSTCQATGRSSYETIYRIPPNIKNLHPFGSPCYVYDHRPRNHRWQQKALLGTMVGYADRLDAYRVYVYKSKQIWVSKCVKFLSNPPTDARYNDVYDTAIQQPSAVSLIEDSIGDPTVPQSTTDDPLTDYNNNDDFARETDSSILERNDSDEESSDSDENQRSCPSPSKMRLRASSERRPPRRFDIELAEVMTPSSYAEAMRSPFAKEWHQAMKDELANIDAHKVWSLVDRPSHKKPISVRWVYRYC